MNSLEDYFQELRFDKKHHLGLGDIRITIFQQELIIDMAEEYAESRAKEVAREAFKAGLLANAADGELFEDGAEADFFDWYSEYIKDSATRGAEKPKEQ